METGEETTCGLCLDLLHDPVSLSCHHNFCYTCVSKKIDEGLERIDCPVCSEVCELPKTQTLPKLRNKCLQLLVSFILHSTTEERIMCMECDATVAQAYCRDCCRCFCRKCSHDLHADPKHLSHEVLIPVHWGQFVGDSAGPQHYFDGDNNCRPHDKPARHFCRNHRQPLCATCVTQHQGDRVVDIKVPLIKERAHTEMRIRDLKEFRAKLNKAIDTLDASERRLEETQKLVEEQLAVKFRVLRDRLDKTELHYQQEMEEKRQPKKYEIQQLRREFFVHLFEVEKAIQHGEETLDQGYCWSLKLMEAADMIRDTKASSIHWPPPASHYSFNLNCPTKLEIVLPDFAVTLGPRVA